MVDISQFSSVGALAVLVLLIIEVFKSKLDQEKAPYAAIVIGIVLAFVFGYVQHLINSPADLVSYVVGGALAGLTAVGGYEATIDKIKVKSDGT
ncbi:MAG: hypothetical protein M1343_06970 [Chloroflexi bacterium]|nr:hypothetical protein [Chloroflexota bacterium]